MADIKSLIPPNLHIPFLPLQISLHLPFLPSLVLSLFSQPSQAPKRRDPHLLWISPPSPSPEKKSTGTPFAPRPVVDYNQIALHFIECIYMHLKNTKSEVGSSASTLSTLVTGTPLSNGLKEHHSQVSNQVSGQNGAGGSDTDIYKQVLDVFQEPASLANDHGLHVDEVVKRLGLPCNKIKEAIDYHVDVGHIYSTIDDYHFKSALID